MSVQFLKSDIPQEAQTIKVNDITCRGHQTIAEYLTVTGGVTCVAGLKVGTAITHDNIEFLTSVPGVGKKTAERMCIELRDKLKDYAGETESKIHDGDTDVIDALVALGYSPAKAYAALSNIDDSVTETNERIKAALNQIN